MLRAPLRRAAIKGDKVVMTAKRETTGAAAKLVMTADRQEISADGEDVAMFAVEVQDAQGRVVPITDNEVTFRVSGAGKLIGVGQRRSHRSGTRQGHIAKGFLRSCMALVQSTKTAGNITVEATSPGLAPASVTIAAKAATLRPQVAVWEREVPTGSGITGLWRPVPDRRRDLWLLAFLAGGGHHGLHSAAGWQQAHGNRGGRRRRLLWRQRRATPDHEGKVDGANISFKAGNSTYSGKLKGDQIELERKMTSISAAGCFSRTRGRPGNRAATGRIGPVDQPFLAASSEYPGCSAPGAAVGRLNHLRSRIVILQMLEVGDVDLG